MRFDLTREQKRTLASEAASILGRDNNVRWVRKLWIADLTDQNVDRLRYTDQVKSSSSIGAIRRWLKRRNLLARNKRCGVCVEGALLLAFAADPTIPDQVVGKDLLRDFQAAAPLALRDLQLGSGAPQGIPDINDRILQTQEDAVGLLDRMSTYY